jgi:hypothetical protein
MSTRFSILINKETNVFQSILFFFWICHASFSPMHKFNLLDSKPNWFVIYSFIMIRMWDAFKYAIQMLNVTRRIFIWCDHSVAVQTIVCRLYHIRVICVPLCSFFYSLLHLSHYDGDHQFLSFFFFQHRKEVKIVSSFSFLYRKRRRQQTRRTVCIQLLFICHLILPNFISSRISIKFLWWSTDERTSSNFTFQNYFIFTHQFR